MKRYLALSLFIFLQGFKLIAQDPHYTQFYSAPLTVNPAYTGVFEGKLRVMSNYRQQWGNLADPYTTSTVSADLKIAGNDLESQNPINVGIQMMNDKSMQGAFKSNYLMATTSYHVNIDYDGKQSIGIGLSGSYGNRRIDFSSISFDRQFTSGGFDLSLPSGETILKNLKPYGSIGAGVLYQFKDQETGTFFDIGLSGYHLNKPKQSVLNDNSEIVPIRYSAQASFQTYLGETALINIKGLYQNQASVSYILGGLSIATLIGESKDMVGAGIWYRSKDAFSPYLFTEFRNFMLGITYDITTSALKPGSRPARSLEFSLQWRIQN
jgi:type IX secretion system PorP/SprF family membrane protein